MAAAQEQGELRIVFESADGSRIGIPFQVRSEAVGHAAPASATDRRQYYPIPTSNLVAGESSIVKIEFKPDAVDIIESEESKALVDITLISKSGARTETQLTFENMTGFKAGDTVDITLIADKWQEISKKTVDAGVSLVLGHRGGGKSYIYIGDDT